MMTKRDKVAKILKLDGSLFDQAWDKVPDTMIKKLNAKEIAEYMTKHVVPTVQKTLINSNAYRPEKTKPKQNLLGVA